MKILDSDHCIAILRAHLDLTGFVAPDNEKTKRARHEAQARYRLESFDTVEDLFSDLKA
jgi:hypothetical protein